MNNKQLMEILEANKSFRTEDEVMNFYRAVQHLDPTDDSLLPHLLKFFDDDAKSDKALTYLSSFIWLFDNDQLVINLVKDTPQLALRATGWLWFIYGIPLEDEHLCNVLIETLHKLSDSEVDAVMGLLDGMFSVLEDDELGRKITEGIYKVKNSFYHN